jgi:hypothetical protein
LSKAVKRAKRSGMEKTMPLKAVTPKCLPRIIREGFPVSSLIKKDRLASQVDAKRPYKNPLFSLLL